MKKIKDILEKEVYILQEEITKDMRTDNGMLDGVDVDINKGFCILESLTDGINDLVTVDQGYPKGGVSATKFTTDVVVMSGQNYNKLIKLLEDGINKAG